MKRKKLVKNALKNPEMFTEGELSFFRLWLQERKHQKKRKKFTDQPNPYTDSDSQL